MEAAVGVDDKGLPKEASPPYPPEVWTAGRGLPAAREVASTVHKGPLWQVPDAISALFAWIGENGYSAAGPYRELHLFWRETELAKKLGGLDSVVIEMQLPVAKAAPNSA